MAEHLRPQRRAAPEAVEGVLSQPGESLDPRIRAWLEPRFEQDFSQVRVYTDHVAAESADALSSLAYTVGNHIVFDSGQYAPETQAGRRLLAHEMTHVAQQSGLPEPVRRALGGFRPKPNRRSKS